MLNLLTNMQRTWELKAKGVQAFACLYSQGSQPPDSALVGEDAAYFAVDQQSTGKWAFFTAELALVLGILYVVSVQGLISLTDTCRTALYAL